MPIGLFFQYRGYILRYEERQAEGQDTAMVRLCTNERVQHQLPLLLYGNERRINN